MTSDYEQITDILRPGLIQNCEKFHMKCDYIDFMYDNRLGRLLYDPRSKKLSLYIAKTCSKNSEMECVYTCHVD
jgi:hypothetical protein